MITYIVDNFIIILSGLLSGSLGLKLFEYFIAKSKRKLTEDFFNDTKEVISIMEDLVKNPNIDRVLLFRGGNGGSTPKIGKDYYIKAIFEAHKDEPARSLLKVYDNVIPDAAYISLLLHLIENKFEVFIVNDMQECLLKKIYIAENIVAAEVFLLHQTKEYVFYGSVASKNNINFNQDIITKLEIESATAKLRKIFERHYGSLWPKQLQ